MEFIFECSVIPLVADQTEHLKINSILPNAHVLSSISICFHEKLPSKTEETQMLTNKIQCHRASTSKPRNNSRNTNFLLTESVVITGKYQTGVLTVRTKPGGRCTYIKDRGRIFSSINQADKVNKWFIKWLVLNKQNILSLVKTYYIRKA